MSADTDPPDDPGDAAEVAQLKDEVRQLKHEYQALAETLREDRPSDEEVVELVDQRLEEKASSSTRRNVVQALGIGGAATLLGGTAGAATSSSATNASLAVGDVTANTYRITDNKFGGPDGAQSELTSELGSDDAGAKFVAQDTGAKYHWTGSAWNKMPVETPSVNTDELSVTNETFVRATRGAATSSTTSGTFINAYDGESKDLRGEFNSSQQFTPDKTGEYEIVVHLVFRGNTAAGDTLRVRIRNTTDGTNEGFQEIDASDSVATASFVFYEPLDSSKTYEIQATNVNSSFKIGNDAFNNAVIKRSVVA